MEQRMIPDKYLNDPSKRAIYLEGHLDGALDMLQDWSDSVKYISEHR